MHQMVQLYTVSVYWIQGHMKLFERFVRLEVSPSKQEVQQAPYLKDSCEHFFKPDSVCLNSYELKSHGNSQIGMKCYHTLSVYLNAFPIHSVCSHFVKNTVPKSASLHKKVQPPVTACDC